MQYKRIHIRVPITGEAVLSSKSGIHIKAATIDISKGGLAVNAPEEELLSDEYTVDIMTEDGKSIRLNANLIHQSTQSAGFQTSRIDEPNLTVITKLVAEYQSTPDFIEQLDNHNILDQNFIDEEGNELEVTFDIDPPKKKTDS